MPRSASRTVPPAIDYHKKPVLSGRVSRESLDWAHSEAERRGQPFGDFLENLLSAERARVANHVVDHSPVLAAEGEQPQQARRNCKHRNMKLGKGVCPDCQEWVSPAASRTNGGQ